MVNKTTAVIVKAIQTANVVAKTEATNQVGKYVRLTPGENSFFPKSITPTMNTSWPAINEKNTNKVGSQDFSTPWMKVAKTQVGIKEATENNDGPEVEKYLKTIGLDPGEKSYWCGAFVNWTLRESGIKVTIKYPGNALDWRNYGQSLNEPAYGSIATKTRKGGGHVGFVAGITCNNKEL